MENMKKIEQEIEQKIENRKELINQAREHLIAALRWNIDIIKDYDIYNDIDCHFINGQIDDTIKLLELLKIRFVKAKDIFKGGKDEE